jgi:hypothetical protein
MQMQRHVSWNAVNQYAPLEPGPTVKERQAKRKRRGNPKPNYIHLSHASIHYASQITS